MKGKIPITSKIKLESDESHWSLLLRGLVKELKISGIIELDPTRKVRIQIMVKEVYSPAHLSIQNVCSTGGNLEEEASGGLNLINEHMLNLLDSKKWIMTGEILGEVNVPIVIVHYCLIKMSFYAQKTKNESIKNFLPFPGALRPSEN